MISALPSRIMNYRVLASSPTDELLTLGQIYSEVGDYASSILDREHLSLSRKCGTRLAKVVGELISRQSIDSAANLYDMPGAETVADDLTSMTIGELHSLYRRWPIRHQERATEGREHLTFYYEGRVVRELQLRKAANKGEQLKIDYCVAAYNNELENLSFTLSLPLKVDEDKIFPDPTRIYATDELVALIGLYSNYRDITEREILIEYVDMALDSIKNSDDLRPLLGLITEIAELGHKNVVHVPKWVNDRLEAAVRDFIVSKDYESHIDNYALALLTLHQINGDPFLERKAIRIINRCYKAVFDDSVELGRRVNYLHISITCCDYVTRFSVQKVTALWNGLCGRVQSSEQLLSSIQMFRLLEIAKELEEYNPISNESKDALEQLMRENVNIDSAEFYNSRLNYEIQIF